nr:Membralin domain containing protein [Haemonchus contortus]
MAERPAELNVDVDVPQANQQQNRNGEARAQAQNNTQFGVVRDRLFHAMLVKVALSYSSHVSIFWRRVIEFISLLIALCLLFTLLFVHLMFTRSSATCLDHIRDTWPRDGVVRLEVVHNLRTLEYKENWINWYKTERSQMKCTFNPADVLRYGPQAMPAEVREGRGKNLQKLKHEPAERESHTGSSLLSYFLRVPTELLLNNDDTLDYADSTEDVDGEYGESLYEVEADAETAFSEHFRRHFKPEDAFRYEYRVEYSLLYGILRLPVSFRHKHNITTLWARVDADSECFGDTFSRRVMRAVVGFEDVVMASLRALAQNSSEDDAAGLGYLHDLSTNEHFHFVSFMMSKTSYITAAIVMLIFTFAISMLLRFSHHQIFLFIVDLLHMFELNQPLVFPAAPLLTVILALVGMEAIMSEVFADTTTAFYVILIVWIADQYDAICCHSHVSKRFWLRFFYLYQFFFYAYQYRFGGQYGGMALITSTAFIFHSMIFFFHHYEMPLILYQDRLQRILTEIDPAPPASPLDVQQVTVSVHTRAVVRDGSAHPANSGNGGTHITVQQDQAEVASTSFAHAELVNTERTGLHRSAAAKQIHTIANWTQIYICSFLV